MASGISTAAQTLDNREHLFRLQMLIIDGGLLVLRSYVDQKLIATSTSLSACLANEKSTITRLRNKAITKVQYDVLFPSSGNVSASDLDITLVVCLLRNLKCFGLNPKFNWNSIPAQGDTSIEAAIYNLKRHRNEMSHASTTTGIQHSTFKTVWKEIKEILLRINSFSANPIADLKQTIKDFKSCPLDPKTENRVQKEIEKWRELEKAVEVDLSIVKADNKRMLEDVKEIKGAIAKIKKENKSKDNLNTAMTDSQYQQRKQELKKHLIKFYKNKRSKVPLSPLFEEKDTPLAGFYVMPDIESVRQKSLTSDQEERIKLESLRDLFITRSEDQQEIYLSADAGFGKTSFSKYLAITWCQACCPDDNHEYFKDEELKALGNFEFLFLVLLRDVKSVCNIDEMIEQQIIKKLPLSTPHCPLQEVLEREKCLIILDGLDEWTHPNNGCSDQKEKIPHRYARDKCVILTTTRPWKLGLSNLKTSDVNKKIEFVQLSDETTYQLKRNAIRKISGINDDYELQEKSEDFDKVIEDHCLEHMQTIPLLLMYITCLWCNKVPIGYTKAEVYINIIKFLISRTAQKYPEALPSPETSNSDIPEYFKKNKFCQKFYFLLKTLAELAYHTLFNEDRENMLVFDGSVAEKYLKAGDIKFSLHTGILTGSTSTTLVERKSKISFSHKTVQEFFAAIFISSQRDAHETVLEKSKTVQSILDMSMICEFISIINPKMMCEISTGFMSMINEDDETRNYRTSAKMLSKPLYNVQNMLLSCLKEMPEMEEIKLCLQDFFIIGVPRIIQDEHLQRLSKLNETNMKSLYIDQLGCTSSEIVELFSLQDLNTLEKLYFEGGCEEFDLSFLLLPSLQTLHYKDTIYTNYGDIFCERIKTLRNVQYLSIDNITTCHEMLENIFNFITGKKTMKEVTLEELSCKEHNRDCDITIDLSKHSQLKKLILNLEQTLQINVTTPSLVEMDLWFIDLGENSLFLTHDMLNIEQVTLLSVTISAASFREFIKVLEDLPQSVTVKIDRIHVYPEKEYDRVTNYIRSSQNFVVIYNDDDDDDVDYYENDDHGSWKFVFQTRKPSKY